MQKVTKAAQTTTIDIKDPFSLMDIRKRKDYEPDGEEIINDLKRCFLVCDSTPEVFMFKDYDAVHDIVKVSYTSETIAHQKLKKITVGYRHTGKNLIPVDAWSVYINNTEKFTVKALKFYSEDPEIFSYFRGYDYNQLDEVKKEVIQPFLNHVHDVIANGDEKVYRYILVWIASILQKPNFKTGTALVLIGNQGTGKNAFFTDVICKLMARYANKNVTKIEDVVGKFNAILQNKKLTILNELQSADTTKLLNCDALKSDITEDTIVINEKNEPMRECENVSNFIMVSNHDFPVKIEATDRRFAVFRVGDKHKQDFEYFEDLANKFTPEFYENLFTFFMTLDISKDNLRRIPATEAREVIREASMTSYEIFVRDNYDKIVDLPSDKFFGMYCKFVEDNKYQQCSSRTFIANVSKFTGPSKAKRIGPDKKVTKVYNLLPDVYMKFKQYHDDLEAEIVEEDDKEVEESVQGL